MKRGWSLLVPLRFVRKDALSVFSPKAYNLDIHFGYKSLQKSEQVAAPRDPPFPHQACYLVPGDGGLRLPLGAAWELHVAAHLHRHVARNAGEHRGDWKAKDTQLTKVENS